MVIKDISDLVVNTDVMADLLGFTRQRINQLASEGVLDKQSPGRYLLYRNIKRYVDFLRAGQRSGEEEEAQADYWSEKALHEKAKRETAEIRLAQLKGQMHEAADVEMVMTNMLATFRNRVLAIPQKTAPKIIGLDNLAEINEAINVELLEALTELSEYDPTLFGSDELVECENDSVSQENIEGSSSTTQSTSEPMGRSKTKVIKRKRSGTRSMEN